MKSPTPNDATIAWMIEKSRTHLGRWGIIVLAAVGYFLLLLAFEPIIGPIATLLLALPVAAITWEFGIIWGFITGLAGIILNSFYLITINNFTFKDLLAFGIIPGGVILFAIIIVVFILRKRMEDYFRKSSESRSREEYFSLLSDITNKILLAPDLNLILQDLSKEMADLISADDSCVVQWNEEKKGNVPSSGETAPLKLPYSLDNNHVISLRLAAAAMNAANTITVDNVENSPYLSTDITKDIPTRSIMSVPLVSHGHKLGAAIFAFNTLHIFTPAEIERVEHAANHIAVAILSSRQEYELTNRLQESDAFAKIAIALSETEHIGLSSVLQLILEFAKDLIRGTEQAVIHLLDPNKEYLIPEALIGYNKSVEGKKKMRLGEGIAGQAVANGEAISIGDARVDPRFLKLDPNSRTRSLIVVPILGGTETLGTISVQSGTPNIFTSHDKSLLSRLGTQASIAIENARLYAATKLEISERMKAEEALKKSIETEREQRLIAETSAEAAVALVSKPDQKEVLDEILIQVQRLIPDCSVNIALVDDEKKLRITSWRGYENRSEEVFSSGTFLIQTFPMAQEILKTKMPIIINDVQKDPRWVVTYQTSWIRSHIAVPLIWQEQTLGVLHIDGPEPDLFNESTLTRLTSLVNAATVALESSQLLNRTQRALRETNALYRINQGLIALNPDELLEDVVDLFQNNLQYDHVQVFLVDNETDGFVLRAGSGEIGRKLMESSYHAKAGTGIIGYVLETGASFYTNNVEEVVFFIKNPLLSDIKSEMAVPVKINEKVVGVIDIQQTPPKQFTDRDLQLVNAVADQLSVALQKANLYNDLQVSLQHEKSVRNQLIQNERLAIMGRLLATVSHELNNPLQAIQNALFLLKSEKGISEQGMQDLEIVLAESERMANLIERLRATYRPTHDEDFQPTKINHIINEVHQLVATHLKHRNIDFIFKPDEHLPDISALSAQVRQVALNLVMNAVDAMDEGGTITVETKLLNDTDEVLISVSDTGAGIDPEILPIIFEAFITNKQSGTGIGLTISHDIVLKHNGRITAENNPDKGASFKVWLPAKTKEAIK